MLFVRTVLLEAFDFFSKMRTCDFFLDECSRSRKFDAESKDLYKHSGYIYLSNLLCYESTVLMRLISSAT